MASGAASGGRTQGGRRSSATRPTEDAAPRCPGAARGVLGRVEGTPKAKRSSHRRARVASASTVG